MGCPVIPLADHRQISAKSSDESGLLPCPFCGSRKLRIDEQMFADDDGEHAGVECLDCECINSLALWNLRDGC